MRARRFGCHSHVTRRSKRTPRCPHGAPRLRQMALPKPLQGDRPFGREIVPLNVIRHFWRLCRDFGPSSTVSTQRYISC